MEQPYAARLPNLNSMRTLIGATGGVTLAQVSAITGIQGSTIQNWVKRGFAPASTGKRYQVKHIARFLLLDRLRDALPLDQVLFLLRYVNGDLEDAADDRIDDVALYTLFCEAVAACPSSDRQAVFEQICQLLNRADLADPIPVASALTVMVMAERAAVMVRQANQYIQLLKGEEQHEKQNH